MLSEIRRDRSSSIFVIGAERVLPEEIDENEEGDDLNRQSHALMPNAPMQDSD
jgi:hypothetical protein